MQFRCDEIATVTGGRLLPPSAAPTLVNGVAIDSRYVEEEQLFVALTGERTDGHDHVAEAAESAAAALISRDIAMDIPTILVENTRRGIIDLGRRAARRLDARRIVLTGSVGKTTTRALIRHVLADQLPGVFASSGNLNSTIGLPLVLCNLPASCRWAILEMGMSRRGELDILGSVAPPDILLYTPIRPVHMQFFSSMEELVEAKGELMAHLPPEGTIIYPSDDPATSLARRHPGRSISYGPSGEISGQIVEDLGFLGGTWMFDPEGHAIRGSLPTGNIHLSTILAAMALVVHLDLDIEAAVQRIGVFQPVAHRGVLVETGTGISILDDSYNASPAAVEEALHRYAATRIEGRRVFLFGDMLEMGPEREEQIHRRIGRLAAATVDTVIGLGRLAGLACDEAHSLGIEAKKAVSLDEAVTIANRILRPNDWILVKGSRSIGLDRAIPKLGGMG